MARYRNLDLSQLGITEALQILQRTSLFPKIPLSSGHIWHRGSLQMSSSKDEVIWLGPSAVMDAFRKVRHLATDVKEV